MWEFCSTQCRCNNSWWDFKEFTVDVAKASGIDHISGKFLKNGAPVIAIYLANIINLSIKLETFPSKCKIAKIKPVFKIFIRQNKVHQFFR